MEKPKVGQIYELVSLCPTHSAKAYRPLIGNKFIIDRVGSITIRYHSIEKKEWPWFSDLDLTKFEVLSCPVEYFNLCFKLIEDDKLFWLG